VLTGAGCSTESNLPDYRSPSGAYSRGFKPMTHQLFMSGAAQQNRYWRAPHRPAARLSRGALRSSAPACRACGAALPAYSPHGMGSRQRWAVRRGCSDHCMARSPSHACSAAFACCEAVTHSAPAAAQKLTPTQTLRPQVPQLCGLAPIRGRAAQRGARGAGAAAAVQLGGRWLHHAERRPPAPEGWHRGRARDPRHHARVRAPYTPNSAEQGALRVQRLGGVAFLGITAPACNIALARRGQACL
jgi:hypothetical protein